MGKIFFVFISVLFLTALLASHIANVSAMGEVAGPVIFHNSVGGSDTESWGLFNDQPINVTISVQGTGAQYVSFPQTVSLPGNKQIVWVSVTANIPSNYDTTQGSNVTGVLYALAQGQPGEVQLNIQMFKNF